MDLMERDLTVSFGPWDVDVEAATGETILDAAERGNVGIEALCGGNGLCGTCMVQVEDTTAVSPVDADERNLLDADQLEAGYRLGCRAEVTEDVSVFVPASSRSEGEIVMTEGREIDFEHAPAIRRYQLEFPAPTLEDTLPDRERVLGALESEYGVRADSIDRLALTTLPTAIREGETDDGDLRTTATVFEESEVLGIDPGRVGPAYGLAIDIGTTTLAIYLLNLQTGEVAAVSSKINPQSSHGGDIISRVQHSTRSPEGKTELQDEIVAGINDSVEEVVAEAGIEPAEIYEAVFVGNTAMHHLFLGIDAGPVAANPYVPANQAILRTKARELKLDTNPAAMVSWLPIIGGWVGPDFVADLLVSGVLDSDETAIVIDIGTNGEIAVSGPEETYVASAPAGPALEGAEIAHGVRAKPGAIQAITLDPDTWEPELDIIEDKTPIGICGSGIIDIVAQLFLVGAINRRGRLVDPEDGHGRVRDTEDGSREFVLVDTDEADIEEAIVVSQSDIRDIQNAKAAIQTGISVLLSEAGFETVDKLIMAGGFGNYIDPESAKLLGLYPEVGAEDVEFLGNAAGYGAMYALLNDDAKAEAERIVEEVSYVELAAWDGFHDAFAQSMYLPHRDFDRYPWVKERVEATRGADDEL
ncbi:ferredoxin [Halodesulfurarchaeum formicicum]|uniref:Ferredoxin n=2 Tax=Halodesulfurarchaeum formicicum TaxID=1873524 RepID=A0A1J1AEI1_9EURY|nr:ferredoxin [Halodesulfurarchaeum formicicum]